MANVLTDPPFAADPPVKVNVDAKVVGLVVGIVAVILAVIDLIGLFGALGLTAICAACGFPVLWLLGALVVLVGDIVAAIGGFRMYQMNRQGKEFVIYGLGLAVLGQVVGLIGTILAYRGYALGFGAGAIVGFIIWLIIRFCVYYLVIISRFPGEAPLVPSAGGYGGYGGGPAPPPPPPTA
jgi:hypothetical protein